MTQPKKPIGATCIVKWLSDGGTERVYISFGEYNEDTEEDGFGVPDSHVWGYSDDVDGIAEAYEHDIKILDAQLVYMDEVTA